MDMKVHLISAMEAVENLLEQGFVPERDIFLAFGHDEEIRGSEGAVKIAEHLQKCGIEPEFVLDEGGCLITEMLPGVDRPLAAVGICEKGFANIRVTAKGVEGHASMPPKSTALGKIANVVRRLEKQQMPLSMTPPVEGFFRKAGPHMSFGIRLLLANRWLFGGLFNTVFAKSAAGNAMLRTTTAATQASGSSAPNVLPKKASAIFNFRILPGDSCDKLRRHIMSAAGEPDLEIEALTEDEPSLISPAEGPVWDMLETTVKQICPEAIVAPYMMMAGSDSRKYECVCRNIYRFTPYLVSNRELAGIHGTNERVSLENITRCVRFFMQLIRNC